MPFVLVGVNHKTCPLDIREKFFLQPAEKELLLAECKANPQVLAAFVLSTCNRTEIYADLLTADPAVIFDIFFKVKHLSLAAHHERFFYVRQEEDMVMHLLRVITGLDSLVLGEKQILGQVKEALSTSREKQMMHRAFNIFANIAIETGKKVRRETQIDCGGSSVAWAAVTKAQQVLGSLEGKDVLIVGSGKMGSLAVQQLKQKGVANIYIMNRTDEKAEELAAQHGGIAVQFWQILETLQQVDVCICSTGAPHYLIEKDLMESVMAHRQDRKMVAVDIAVPRNIAPDVASVPGVALVSVDDLSQTVQDNMNKRSTAVEDVEAIIKLKANEFYRALDKAAMFDVLKASGIEKGVEIR